MAHKQYSQNQVVEAIYRYVVEGQSAQAVCHQILKMPNKLGEIFLPRTFP